MPRSGPSREYLTLNRITCFNNLQVVTQLVYPLQCTRLYSLSRAVRGLHAMCPAYNPTVQVINSSFEHV